MTHKKDNPEFVPWLVIGYGNTLRSDDAVGPRAVEALEKLQLPGVSTITLPLLAPEAAEPVSRARQVIFVDAAPGEPEVTLRILKPAHSSQVMAHAAWPETILALARDLFGHCPDAWLVAIPVEDLSLGEGLSPLAKTGLTRAMELLQARLQCGTSQFRT